MCLECLRACLFVQNDLLTFSCDDIFLQFAKTRCKSRISGSGEKLNCVTSFWAFHHSNFEDAISFEDISLLAIVVCCLSLHICTYFHWLQVENMAGSDWLQCKVIPHWLTQKHGRFWLVEIQNDSSLADTIAASDWLNFKVTPHWLTQFLSS